MKLKPSPCEYKDSNHTYTSKSNGKLWPGVTSIIGNIDKPYLRFWAVKLGMETVDELWEAGKAYLEEEKQQILGIGKTAHTKKAREAADSGTIAHNWIDEYIAAKISGEPRYQAPIQSPEAEKAVEAFLEWEESHNIQWLAGDTVVGSAIHEFGGKLDGLAMIDGKSTLIDFKTSNQISPEYFLQTAAYQLALEEMGYKCEQRLILRIPKTGKQFEALIVPTPLDLDTETFLACRQIQRWKSYIDNEGNGVTDNGRVVVK